MPRVWSGLRRRQTRSCARRGSLGQGSTHCTEREPERRRVGLWWLRQLSSPDVGGDCLVTPSQHRQVCSQPPDLLLLVAPSVPLSVSLVVGTSSRQRVAVDALLRLLLPMFRPALVDRYRAVVQYEVTVDPALLALIIARRNWHRRFTARDPRRRRLPGLLVDIVVMTACFRCSASRKESRWCMSRMNWNLWAAVTTFRILSRYSSSDTTVSPTSARRNTSSSMVAKKSAGSLPDLNFAG